MLLVVDMAGDLALQRGLQHSLGQLRAPLRARSTSIATSCSSDSADGITPPAGSATDSCSIAVSHLASLLDQQIRR
ncbi:hypothetical protein [Streptomyces coffeae]|uniref:Uncharacterized protein n=1 Tax=Streptomyces coffeae TaxID=621382 RepID=A0ABS1NP37_9ACTN|nr:hypothetical protein [Streptomyces coffeae]MBL1101838.1 hypothetical protein [Streptomyces coffeae]